ncbi:hypothetical protein PDESU_01197 [Pontiella desulfatans]|uniref:Three-Cys-motif partner protein TcmP n=1 Tax=Pontiella desulfatans TaxID=2750659 RepID=A0A6C2TYV7_PONDE|nr:three-Cys-motif partner protein TcmP [Pontiella desulfatans]VGO12644.1 hypothetical protein PDESU_01197 [Pontiella desulfatans]
MKPLHSPIEMDLARHPACKKCRNKEERKLYLGRDHCEEVVSVVDELPIRCVGEWAYDKIYRLVQYFGIFAPGMHKKWEREINYIEICCGPGRCVLRESAEEINGTALAILKDERFEYIKNALFIDRSPKVVEALNSRINKLQIGHKAKAVVGDFTDRDGLVKHLKKLNPRSLNLVLIDPTECNVPFSTIQLIANELKSVDFIINVALGTDANRNLLEAVKNSSFKKARAKYAEFLGSYSFFERKDVLAASANNNRADLRKLFAEEYEKQLAKLGFAHTDTRSVRHYYYLLFASKHQKGLEFWNKACRYDPDGQKELF